MSPTELVRPQIGLMLSCGEPPEEGRKYPRKLDYMRPKPGALGQFSEAATKFTQIYGDRPKVIDILFLSDEIVENLDVRPMVFGTSGPKARGLENLAGSPPNEFGDRIRAYDWELMTFPDDRPEPGRYVVEGREDTVVTRLGLKVYAQLYVSIPEVLGIAMVAAITTTSARTAQNWFDALHRIHRLTGGVLVGIPCKLILRPARGRYWDEKTKSRKVAEFQEWVIDSHHTARQLYEIAAERRHALAGGPLPLALEAPKPKKRRKRELPKRELEALEAVELGPIPDVEEMIEAAEFSEEQQAPDAAIDETLASADG